MSSKLKYYVVTVAGAFLIGMLLSLSSISLPLSKTTTDLLYRRPATADVRVKIIGVDEASIERIGPWPWSSDVIAELIDFFAEGGAAALGINTFFSSPSNDPQADSRLALAMEMADNVVVPAVFNASGVDVQAQRVLYPFQLLKEVSRQGVKIHLLDDDGVLRRAFVTGRLSDDIETSSFAHAVYETFLEKTGLPHLFDTSRLVNGQTVIDFSGGNDQFEVIPAHHIIEGLLQKDYFSGAIVLVGNWSAQAETFFTPFDRSWPTYDIAVEANIIQQLINGRNISVMPFWGVILLSLLLATVTATLLDRFTSYAAVGMVLLASVLVVNLAWLGYTVAGTITPIFEPVITMLLALLIGLSYTVIDERIRWTDQFLNSFIDVMITQIETQTKYNADHTNRVKPLAMEIARHVKGLDKNALSALSMASSLHDIGKISIPSMIMNKATRLGDRAAETYSRIHCFKAHELTLEAERMEPSSDVAESRDRMLAISRKYGRYYDVVKKLDIPENTASDEDREIIKEMATLSVGLEHNTEFLLSPKDIDLLSIERGTLSEEERQTMELHVEYTRRFLSHIEFSGRYQSVPDIATKHHEKLNGEGYPDGLTGDYIQKEARILAIADVIDALMARDRPYKKPASSQQCKSILFQMVDRGEIDKDIVSLVIDHDILNWYEKTWVIAETD